jgi:nitrogen fixation NifU-like protein
MTDLGDDFYRENILDHYKSPRNYGELEHADAHAEGMNPLCGDETAIAVKFAADGETIQDIRFVGRGCAISMASTSMLTELVKGRRAAEVAAMSKDELLEDMPPLTPVRLKCALLGLTTLKLALHKGAETPLPEGLEGLDELELK